MSKRKYSSFLINDILRLNQENWTNTEEYVPMVDKKRFMQNENSILRTNNCAVFEVCNDRTLSAYEVKDYKGAKSSQYPSNKENVARNLSKKSLQICKYCQKEFNRPSLLERHLRVHTGEKPFQCPTCSRRFSTSSSLNTHKRIHTGEKPCLCSYCGKAFTAASNLYYHLLTHKKTMPHKCTSCGKGFSTPSELLSHIPVHTGQWPHTCPCGKTFSKSNLFRTHLMGHIGIRPEKCLYCDKKFTIPSKLIEHIKYMHGVDHNCKYTDAALSISNLLNKVEMMYR